VPGMPNRWSGGRASAAWIPLRCERVVEVTCENISGLRFRHPARFLRWRPDKDPADCRIDQLEQPVPAEFGSIFGPHS
jgi:ATP-dependent DNA ligase